MKTNKFLALLFCAATLFSLSSCDELASLDDVDDSEDVLGGEDNGEDGTGSDETIEYTSYIYTLNNGSYGYNNTTLSSYNIVTEAVVEDIFVDANGQGLGDTAQDILVFDDKLFITVYGSGVIFVTDLSGAILKEITHESYTMPRCLATDGDNIYVSYYDGGVAKMDPETYDMVSTSASINPDQLTVVDDMVYVTVSQGYGNYNDCNSIDVYNATTMTFEKRIEVVVNPTNIVADELGNIYVLSMGNYSDISAALQKIDIATEEATTLYVSGDPYATPLAIAMGSNNTLYVLEGAYDDNWNTTGMIYTYDATTEESSAFIADGESVLNTYSLSLDTESGEVYLGISDYYNTGDVYVYNAEGELQNSISAGLNPQKSVRVEISEE